MKHKLTKLEKDVLQKFTEDEFYEFGVESILWADVFSDTVCYGLKLNRKSFSGVMSSLSKKGYLASSGTGRDDTVMLLDLGRQYVKEFIETEQE
jgi:hypothetical protein